MVLASFEQPRPSPRRAPHRGRVPQLRRPPPHEEFCWPHRQEIRQPRQRELGLAPTLAAARLRNTSSRRWRVPARHPRTPGPPVLVYYSKVHPRFHPPTDGHLRQIPSPRLSELGLIMPENKTAAVRFTDCRRFYSKLENQFRSDLDLPLRQKRIAGRLDNAKLRICHERRRRGGSTDGEVSRTDGRGINMVE